MASIDENRRHWSEYDWSRRGQEWSETWGGSGAQWWGTIQPRIRAFLPCHRGLELASGAGRWSEFLADSCDELDLVDVTPVCVERTRRQFEGSTRVRSHLNDGRSLPMIGDSCIDFVFSFDSFVHVELDVLESYLAEIARILASDGAAFLHHSNFAALLANPPEGLENRHWRAESVSSEAVARLADECSLTCIGQELVNWGCPWLTDCFSLLVRKDSRWSGEPRRVENPFFMDSASSVRLANAAFGSLGSRPAGTPGSEG